MPIMHYAITIHVPAELGQHLRQRSQNTPASLHFSGPLIWKEEPVHRGAYPIVPLSGPTSYQRANSSDHPLLPAGPPVPVAELDFLTNGYLSGLISALERHPIKIEFWGGTGTQQTVTMHLKHDGSDIRYIES